MALIDKLSAIGDAIREKTGKSELLTLEQMPAEIASINTGGGEVEPIVLTGDQSNKCGGEIAAAYVELYGDTISSNNITNAQNMFSGTTLTKIPFSINLTTNSSGATCTNLFSNAKSLTEVPKITGKPAASNNMFGGCSKLTEIPDDVFEDVDFSVIRTKNLNWSYMFSNCTILRRAPVHIFQNHMYSTITTSYIYYTYAFQNCYALDELVNLPVPYTAFTLTTNVFTSTFNRCGRLKNITFETPGGQPVVVKWKSQTIPLNSYIGYSPVELGDYNPAFADKKVTDDASYQALKNDSDWWTRNSAYSRYNHDSAVATINSLPDASAGSGNTIKFLGNSGSKTDGGAISNLTEEEIAVAAAKGWTVTFV